MTILKLSESIKKYCESKSYIVYHELPIDDPFTRCPDIIKAKKILNWDPKVRFEEGIKKKIEWFSKN